MQSKCSYFFHLDEFDIIPVKDLSFIYAYKKFYKDTDLDHLNNNVSKQKPYGSIIKINLWVPFDK